MSRFRTVFLLDIDNTLIDNDLARDRLWRATDAVLGRELSAAYWRVYEEVRADCGVVDTLETLGRFHRAYPDAPGDALDRAILDLPYADVRYPATLGVLETLRRHGPAVVLSDGDAVFQPLKIQRAGIAAAVDGVVVFDHKDEHLEDVERLFPAERYVVVDDKAAILARVKVHWQDRVRTVHVLQGKYSDDAYEGPAPDVVIDGIGALAPLAGSLTGEGVLGEERAWRST